MKRDTTTTGLETLPPSNTNPDLGIAKSHKAFGNPLIVSKS